MSKFINFLSRLWWDFVYKVVRYQYVLYTIVFAGFSVLLFQYWQVATVPATQGFTEDTVGGIPVTLWTPEKILIGADNLQEIEVLLDTSIISEEENVKVYFSSVDKNVSFSEKTFDYENEDENKTGAESTKTTFYYRRVLSPADSFTITAKITIGESETDISRNIQLDSVSQTNLIFFSAIFSGILALINFYNQAANLLKKKK